MNKPKKAPKRQILPTQKKNPLKTVPSSYLIEEPRVTTASSDMKNFSRSFDLRKISKSIELAKPVIAITKKKAGQQRVSSKMGKMVTGASEPLRAITQTFKQLKQMKIVTDKSRQKSKSPARFKSRSASKLFPKKKSPVKLAANHNSERILALKLHKTLKQVNLKEIAQEDDSQLIKSSSDRIRSEIALNISTENEDFFNIAEMKNFSSQVQKRRCNDFSMHSYTNFQQHRAASKIQRAWRRHRTKMLVERYASLATQIFNEESYERVNLNTESGTKNKKYFHPNTPNEEPINTFEDREQINKYNNAEKDNQLQDYDQIVNKFKREELERWDQIISIISLNKSNSPSDIERLLQKLTQQSQINKQHLQAMTYGIINRDCKKEVLKNNHKQLISHSHHNREPRFEYSSSDRSIQINEYDNKKYIEFLDADIFPHFAPRSPSLNSQKISKAKQQILLESLQSKPIHQLLNHSQSSNQIPLVINQQTKIKIPHRRVASDNNKAQLLQREEKVDVQQGCIDVDKLIEDFLQGINPNEKSEDGMVSEDKLRLKIAELHKLRQQYEENQGEEHSSRQDTHIQQEEVISHSPPSFQLHQIKVEDQPAKLQPQNIHKREVFEPQESDFESISDNESDQINNKAYETCASIIMDKLVLQILKQIAQSDIICEAFKSYSRFKRSKNKSTNILKKKKGFATSKTEVELFMTNLLKYLQKQEPNIFKNLQVPTGPSALEMLRFMHQHVEENDDESEDNQATIMVIPNRVFDAFWHIKEKSIVISFPQNVDQSTSIFKQQLELLKSLNKIFYRCLFDTFNQCLDCERNFGQFGRPFPWKKTAVFNHNKSHIVLRNHVENAKKRMMEVSTIYCGLIVEKEDIANFDEEYIKQVHQQRLSRMLANDFLQLQDRWIFYDDEETEILVEISHKIFGQLILEALQSLLQMV